MLELLRVNKSNDIKTKKGRGCPILTLNLRKMVQKNNQSLQIGKFETTEALIIFQNSFKYSLAKE
jgi:hypothetical protein